MTGKISFRKSREDVMEIESEKYTSGEVVEMLRKEEAVLDGHTISKNGEVVAKVLWRRGGMVHKVWNIVPKV